MSAVGARHYCTYFDSYYLLRGLTLYHSLRRHVADFTLHVLCLDHAAQVRLRALQLPGLHTVSLAELEQAQPQLLTVKPQRSRPAYYFTLTPHWIRHALQAVDGGATLTYLDADLFLLGDPQPADAQLGDGAVLLVPHRFPPGAEARERAGRFNVGYLTFRRDTDGIAALDWWCAACLDWCDDRVDGARYADQGYLDEFPQRFARVRICAHIGINAAPWNIAGNRLTRHDGAYRLDGQPLLVYHFHGLRRLGFGVFDTDLAHYGVEPDQVLLQLYAEYLYAMQDIQQRDLPFGRPRTQRRLSVGDLVVVLSRSAVLLRLGARIFGLDLRRPARGLLRLWSGLVRGG